LSRQARLVSRSRGRGGRIGNTLSELQNLVRDTGIEPVQSVC
jgi:hypothetical protein